MPDLFFISIIGLVAIKINEPMWSGGVPGWCDNYGHAEKIWFTANYLKEKWQLPRWDPYWACGYPIYQFYPPLSYLIAAIITIILNSFEAGYTITLECGQIIGGALTYLFVRRIIKNRIAGLISGLYFSLCPFFYRYWVLMGAFPNSFGTMVFIPASFLLLEWVKRDSSMLKQIIVGAAVFSFAILTHIFAFLMIGCAIIVFWSSNLLLIKENRRNIEESFKILITLLLSISLALGLMAFWLIPALAMSHRMITFEYSKMGWEHVKPMKYLSSNWSWLLSLLPSFLLLKSRKVHRPYVLSFLVFVLWTFGHNFPLTWWLFSSLPVVGSINPQRMSIIAEFFKSIIAGFSFIFLIEIMEKRITLFRRKISSTVRLGPDLRRYGLGILFLVLFLYPIVDNISVYRVKSHPVNPPEAFVEICKGLEPYPEHRVEIIKVSGRSISFLWHKKPLFEMGFREGTQVAWFIIKDVWRSRIPPAQQRDYMVDIYKIFNVGYMISVKDDQSLSADSNFEVILSNDRFKVYRLIKPSNYTAPAHLTKIFVASRYESGVKILSKEMLPGCKSIFVRTGSSSESLDFQNLEPNDAVLLFGYDSLSSNLEQAARSMLKKGGIMFIDTYNSPDENKTLFGVKSRVTRSHGEVSWTFTDKGQCFLNGVNLSLFSRAEWQGAPWEYTIYNGLDEVYAYVNDNPVLGVKRVGSGKVVFIGFNLFLHMMYYYNYEEAKMLTNIFNYFTLGNTSGITSSGYANIVHREPESIEIEYETDAPYIVVSEAYYPAWEAIVDASKPVKIYDYFNIMAIQVPSGKHTLVLIFKRQWYDYTGIATSVSTIAFMAFLAFTSINNRKLKRRSERIIRDKVQKVEERSIQIPETEPTTHVGKMLFDGYVDLLGGQYRCYLLTIRQRRQVTIKISVEGAGSINFYIMSKQMFLRWKAEEPYTAYVSRNQINQAVIKWIPSQPGEYYFLFDNTRHAINKSCKVQVFLNIQQFKRAE